MNEPWYDADPEDEDYQLQHRDLPARVAPGAAWDKLGRGRRERISPFYLAASQLRAALQNGSVTLHDPSSIIALTDDQYPWGQYVDPRMSTYDRRGRAHLIALWFDFGEYVGLQGSGSDWEVVGPEEAVTILDQLDDEASIEELLKELLKDHVDEANDPDAALEPEPSDLEPAESVELDHRDVDAIRRLRWELKELREEYAQARTALTAVQDRHRSCQHTEDQLRRQVASAQREATDASAKALAAEAGLADGRKTVERLRTAADRAKDTARQRDEAMAQARRATIEAAEQTEHVAEISARLTEALQRIDELEQATAAAESASVGAHEQAAEAEAALAAERQANARLAGHLEGALDQLRHAESERRATQLRLDVLVAELAESRASAATAEARAERGWAMLRQLRAEVNRYVPGRLVKRMSSNLLQEE